MSPGIDPGWEIVAQLTAAGIPIESEIEFGFRNSDVPVIAVTGTNGKTTTTELTTAVLNAAGKSAAACGNYGVAYCDVVRSEGGYDYHVVEVSSFQLELIDTFRARISVWMNFASDHLDRHPSLEAYRAAKLRIFENQTGEDFAVVNYADVPDGLTAAVTTFSAFDQGSDFYLEDNAIYCRGSIIADFGATNLRGKHNAENVMAAMAAANLCGVDFAMMSEAIASYRPQRHRCELVAEIDGVEYINDSKSTNLHSLESSLRSLRLPLILIAGGKDKGLDYGELRELVRNTCSHVVAIGEIAASLTQSWGDVVPCECASGMAEAVSLARDHASPGHTVLLSPGTSSFDMFGGYQERGDAFCQHVTRLPQVER